MSIPVVLCYWNHRRLIAKYWPVVARLGLGNFSKKGYKVFFTTSYEVKIIVINDYQSRPAKLKPVGTKSAFRFHRNFVFGQWSSKWFCKWPARYNLTIVSREQVLSELQAKEESKKDSK